MTDEIESQYENLKKRFEGIESLYSSLVHDHLGKYFKIFRPKFSEEHWRELLDISHNAYELVGKAPVEGRLWSKTASFSSYVKFYTRDSKNAEKAMTALG